MRLLSCCFRHSKAAGSLQCFGLGVAVGFLLLMSAAARAQSVRFVATDGVDASNCLDPADPCLTISHALAVAGSGDTIEIAAGSYKPDPGPPATGLVIDKDISLQGVGPDQTWIVRDLADPAYRLITIDADPGGHQVVLSGLRLRLGLAEGSGEAGRGGAIYNPDASGSLTLSDVVVDFNQARAGGGLFNGQGVSPLIEDSVFDGNIATERGGAIYNWTDSAPALNNVQFQSNEAGIFGGALFNNGNNALTVNGGLFQQNSAVSGCGAVAMKNTPVGGVFHDSTFIDNTTEGDGGALCLDATSPLFDNVVFQNNSADGSATDNNGGAGWLFNGASPTFRHVTFTGNSSNLLGGALHIASASSPEFINAAFEGNSALFGGALHVIGSSSPILKVTSFSGNTSFAEGGAMFNGDGSNPVLDNIVFLANRAYRSGGAMFNTGASAPAISNAIFDGNTADDSGGGLANEADSNPELIEVIFRSNESLGAGGDPLDGGGGVSNLHSDPVFRNVRFQGNTAPRGGGMLNVSSSPQLVNVLFFANTADTGGGINNDSNGTPTLTNVSFSGNEASSAGGALANTTLGNATLYNAILWGNTSAIGNELYVSGTSSLTLHNTLYANGPGDSSIDGTLMCIDCLPNANPSFVDAQHGNLRLESNSPAIDAGAFSTSPTQFPTDDDANRIDLFGWPRFYGQSIDMGANEWQPRPDDLFQDRFQAP